jgi:hypothetical protein
MITVGEYTVTEEKLRNYRVLTLRRTDDNRDLLQVTVGKNRWTCGTMSSTDPMMAEAVAEMMVRAALLLRAGEI